MFFQVKDGVLFSKDGTKLIAYPRSKQERQYQIPEGVVWIGTAAFAQNDYLEEVVFSDTVTAVLHHAFEGCDNLSTVVFNEGLQMIDDNSFEIVLR